MTIKLFYQNQNIINFSSRVEEVVYKNDEYHIALKETAFYPEGGGQPSDIGFIEGVKVEKVYEIDDKIYHITKSPINKEFVQGFIDFERRFDFMQQHSGEHLLAAAFYKLYNGHNIGFHLGEDYITIDVTLPTVNNQMINSIEDYVNSLIFKNIPIKTYMVDDFKLNTIPLRKRQNIKVILE
jgi:alanyl-tRNA synthetase